MPNESDLERQVRELKEENARLRAMPKRGITEPSVREEEYKGHAILVFERPTGRPFSLGVSKLATIRACWHKVEEFLQRHPDTTTPEPGQPPGPGDQGI